MKKKAAANSSHWRRIKAPSPADQQPKTTSLKLTRWRRGGGANRVSRVHMCSGGGGGGGGMNGASVDQANAVRTNKAPRVCP